MEDSPLIQEEQVSTITYFSHEEEYLSKKSNYSLPYSLLPIKATYGDVITYLKDENLLTHFSFVKTRNDVLPLTSTLATFENDTFGASISNKKDDFVYISKTIGEGLERFLMSSKENSIVKTISIQRDDKKLHHLKNFPTFLAEQQKEFPDLFHSKNDTLECVITEGLLSKSIVTLPAQYIFWKDEYGGEEILVPRTTNGCGAHFTHTEAVVSGLYEQIERDTFLMYWLGKMTPKKIDTTTIKNNEAQLLLQSLTQKDIDVHICYLENKFSVPVFVCVLIDTRATPYALSIGSGISSISYEKAITGSIYEAISVLTMNLSFTKERRIYTPTDIPFTQKNIGRTERITMWNGSWIIEKINFFISGEIISLKSLPQEPHFINKATELLHILNNLLSQGISDVLVYTVQSKHLKRLSYHVVKVIVPEFMQLYLREHLATLSSKRLSKTIGVPLEKLTVQHINPVPHPFP